MIQPAPAKSKDRVAQSVAIIIVLGFFLVLFLVLYLRDVGETGLVLLGAAGSAFGTVVSYYFGSSAGSRDKDAYLQERK